MSLASLSLVLLQQAVPFSESTLFAPEGTPTLGFGSGVALFEDTLLLGDGNAFVIGAGSATAYQRTESGQWAPSGLLEPAPGIVTQGFGTAVAAGPGLSVVGAPCRGGVLIGSAHIFELSGTWRPTQTLRGSQGSPGDEFAHALALDGDRLLVGAPGADIATEDDGAAYLFERGRDGSWQEVELFTLNGPSGGSKYGDAVDLNGERFAIGASGAPHSSVEVYARVNGEWAREALIEDPSGSLGSYFGASVALSGDRLAVGAPHVNGPGSEVWQGQVMLYERSAQGEWVLQDTLLPSQAGKGDQFGTSVDLAGERLAIGAPLADAADLDCGVVSLYEIEAGEWIERERLTGTCGGGEVLFGERLVLSSGTLAVSGWGSTFEGFVQPFALVPFDTLTGWPGKLSVAEGGLQQLRIDLGPSFGGLTYLMLGSASGATPSTLVDGVSVPIVSDNYTLATLFQANTGPFVDTFGVLDSDGRAEPGLELAATSDPSLAGILLHHAALIFDTTGAIQAIEATVAVDLALLP